jgi:chemotaxis protein methyltransferase CheR
MMKFETCDLDYLFSNILNRYNTDLSLYAPSSLERRLERFLTLNHITTLNTLTNKLVEDNLYYDYFIKEITVNTTEMFRDPSCWKIIRENILPTLKDVPSIRIWHAGCSSGEEVLSMAILLKEANMLHKAKIIASDLNKAILEDAKKASYSIKSLQINQENYIKSGGINNLEHYYKEEKSNMVINQELLANLTFMRHDLSTGIPFSKFDIILCRNVMIYFNKNLQERLFSLFHKSLFKNSFIIIGKKEAMSYYSDKHHFLEYNEPEKIYKLISS